MKKLWIIVFIVWNLQAQNFDAFLQNALQNSPYLKANALQIQRADEEAVIIQRYKNPTLLLEASEFKPDIGQSKTGYRGALTQPVRLWGIGKTRAKLSAATKDEAKGFAGLKRAEFIRDLSLFYIDYMTQSAYETLAKEELKIVQKIADISQERYKAGTIAKVKYLLAKVDGATAKNTLNEREAEKFSSYSALLAFAGQPADIALADTYKFVLSRRADSADSAKLHFMISSQKRIEQEAKLNSNQIEWIDLYAEYEKEPDQSIARVGVDIPLAVFNTKKEEKRIALLRAKQKEYLIENQKTVLSRKLARLKYELKILNSVLTSTKELYRSQKELLAMYEDGYKIANINLVELQNMKNQMIKTREKEILLQNKIDKNIVLYNYETGKYNE